MISFGWRLVGSKTVSNLAPSSPEGVQTNFGTFPFFMTDNYAYVKIAYLFSSTAGTPQVEIVGTNFVGESSQNAVNRRPISTKIGATSINNSGPTIPANTIEGIAESTTWGSINTISDVTAKVDGEILGLMHGFAGVNGPEMAEVGTTNNSFGSFASQFYNSRAGSATLPSFHIIPLSLFACLQFVPGSGSGTETMHVIACPFG